MDQEEEEEEEVLVVRKVNNDDENMISTTTTTTRMPMTVTNAMVIVEVVANINGYVEHVSQLCTRYFVIYMIGSMLMFMMDYKNISRNKRIVGVVCGILIAWGFFSCFRRLHARALNKVHSFLIMNHHDQPTTTTTTALESSNAVLHLILWCTTSLLCLFLLVTLVTDKIPRTSNELVIAQLVYMVILLIFLNHHLNDQPRSIYNEMNLYDMMIKQQNSAATATDHRDDLQPQQHWECTTPMLCCESCDCLATKEQLNKVIRTNDYKIESENWRHMQEHDQRSKLVDMLCEDARKKYQLSTQDTRLLLEIISS